MARSAQNAGRSWTRPYLSTGISFLAAVGAAIVVSVSVHAIIAGAMGALVLVLGLVRSSPRLLTVGAAGLFVGVVIAGLLGMAPAYLLGAAFLVALAWDAGLLAASLVAEVGGSVSTLRVEVVRLSSTTVVLAVGGAAGYLVFRTVPGDQPPLALVALLLGATALLAVLRSS